MTTKTKKAAPFSDDELKWIGHAAQGVWQEIGADCLVDEDGRPDESATMKKAHVVEVVLDASRFEERLRRDLRADVKRGRIAESVVDDLMRRVEIDMYGAKDVPAGRAIEKHLKKNVFTFAVYGY